MLRPLLFLLPATSFAAESASPTISPGTYIQAGLAFILIIVLLIGTAWLARKVSGGKGFGQGGLKIIGGVALGPRERIVLLEIGNERLVVGIVPGQIRTLHRQPKPADEAENIAPEKPFKQWLQTFTEQHKHE